MSNQEWSNNILVLGFFIRLCANVYVLVFLNVTTHKNRHLTNITSCLLKFAFIEETRASLSNVSIWRELFIYHRRVKVVTNATLKRWSCLSFKSHAYIQFVPSQTIIKVHLLRSVLTKFCEFSIRNGVILLCSPIF